MALTTIASRSVYTNLFAYILTRALVLVDTSRSVFRPALVTQAGKTTNRVLTLMVAAAIVSAAFIFILA